MKKTKHQAGDGPVSNELEGFTSKLNSKQAHLVSAAAFSAGPMTKIYPTPCKIFVYITFLQHGCQTYRHYCLLQVHSLRHHYCCV